MSICICHQVTFYICSRFDSKRIVSGAYDGKIKVWDLQAAMDPRSGNHNLSTSEEILISSLEKSDFYS